jgi:hypothetical protein
MKADAIALPGSRVNIGAGEFWKLFGAACVAGVLVSGLCTLIVLCLSA